jgi:ADP-heptose:LPS heptosyltransferase
MQKIIKIDGGIGRVICATGAIRKLANLDPETDIVIISSWPEVFENNPYILKLYKDGSIPYLFEDVIKHGLFSYPEPYHERQYYIQQEHLIASFDRLITGYSEKIYPEIFLTEEEKSFGLDVVSKALAASGKKSAIAYQPYGSGASMSNCGVISDPSYRSLTDDLNKKILTDCKDSVFINLSHIPINHPNCWQQSYTLRQLFAVASSCHAVVSIDSVLSHLGIAFEKKGVLILGSTYSINVGYDEYKNYETFQKSGYPRSYQSNRFGGHVEKNKYAMDFDGVDQVRIIDSIARLGSLNNDNGNLTNIPCCDSLC